MKRTSSLLTILSPLLLAAQDLPVVPCLANDLVHVAPYVPSAAELEQMAQDEADLELFTDQFIAQDQAARGGDAYIISVVFHIIHDNGPENISNEQVEDAIRVLNDDFNKLNNDWQNVNDAFLGIVADVGVEFRLARKDPQGNCTNGITRTESILTHQGDQAMKNLIQWPRNRYLNVWVCAYANGAAGYTYRPGPVNNQPTWDGIVLQHNYTGSIGTSSPNSSRTLTHEVGHWINLAHTWGNSNEPNVPSNCSDDDGVADTPNTVGWTSCNLNGTSCGSLDNVENYMEYSFCSKMFTNGQKARMLAALNASTAQRNQLWTPATLNLTGVLLDDALCAADFGSDARLICAGTAISFEDMSYNDVDGWNWSFPGGEPTTSTEQHPTVVYPQAGTYAVTLVASLGLDEVTLTRPAYITVLPNPGAEQPYQDGFEAYTDLDDSPWTVVNHNNDAATWSVSTAAAFTGSKSLRMQNSASFGGRKDDLISEPIDAEEASQVIISYRYAYAQRSTGDLDRLRVFVSNNCGATWNLRQQLTGNQSLNTAGGPVSGGFVPTADQWGYSEVTNISDIYYVSDLRVRFEFESDGGNHLYLDDINIMGQPMDVDDLPLTGDPVLAIVPNPAMDQAMVVLNAPADGLATLELLDIAGRRIASIHAGALAQGEHRMQLPVGSLAPGAYLVRFVQGGGHTVVRLIKH